MSIKPPSSDLSEEQSHSSPGPTPHGHTNESHSSQLHTPYGHYKFYDPGNAVAFMMAIDALKYNTKYLADYDIDAIMMNDACNADVVMKQYVEIYTHHRMTNQLKNIIGFVGPPCSDTIKPLAGITNLHQLPIISYGAEGAIFSDQKDYPYFFRTIPENKIFRHVFFELFLDIGWKRIASLTEDGHRYSEYMTPLHELLEVRILSKSV